VIENGTQIVVKMLSLMIECCNLSYFTAKTTIMESSSYNKDIMCWINNEELMKDSLDEDTINKTVH
jgi:hypothetical protein